MINQRWPQPREADELERNRRSDRALNNVLHACDQLIHVGWPRLERLPSRKRQQPMSQGRRPLHGSQRRRYVTLNVIHTTLSHPRLRQFERP
jgi:hypothetical protein